MTTPHSIAEFTDTEVSPENNRKGTVSYASRFEDHQRIPAIIMKGQWLEVAGFATGTKIDIKVMEGCIVITAKQPEPETGRVAAPAAQAVGAQAKTSAGVNRRDRRAET